jgi:hypothetical protein
MIPQFIPSGKTITMTQFKKLFASIKNNIKIDKKNYDCTGQLASFTYHSVQP